VKLLLVVLALAGLAAVLLARGGRPDIADPKVQLRAVRGASFEPRPILNRSEFRVFAWLEAWAEGTPYRVFAQVPYGEVLRTEDRDAFRSVNSKRADMLIVDARGFPVAAIEVQGEGHWQGNARARDAVKRAALESAGVALIEVFPRDDRDAVLAAVEEALRR
jgi:hypothetical protein